MRITMILGTVCLLVACQSSPAPTQAKNTQPPKPALVCPVSGRPIQGDGASAYYGVYEIICVDREAANQFGTLPPRKRAALAGPQVLARQGITNTICPLTGKPLDAEAVAVTYQGTIYGFACLADANQFLSLPKKKQAAIISQFTTTTPGATDTVKAS